jgi:tetratricopeptide (TPR) repeat protein
MTRLLLSTCLVWSFVSFAAGTPPATAAAAAPAPAAAPPPAAPAAPALISVAIFPPVGDKKTPEGLALAMQARATSLLASTGKYAVISYRQIANMAARHGTKLETLNDPNVARESAQRLGVKHFVFSKLTPTKEGWTIEMSAGTVGELEMHASTASAPKGEAGAVAAVGQNLAVAAAKVANAASPVAVEVDAKDAAVRDWAACEAQLAKQPIGVENPTVLNETELTRAVGLCGAAVKASPALGEAWAALALAAAIDGTDERAVFALTQADATKAKAALPLANATLARFWLVTRYQSTDAGEQVLKDAIAKEPGFLLARGYLAELYNAEGKHAEAAKVWQDYTAVTPNNPFLISRLAYTLARLGKTADAAKFAEKALAYDPDSVDLNLELASRYVDAGDVKKAITVLEPLAKPADARAEAVLRLGFAKQHENQLDEAEKLYQRAFTLASKDPADWRTRGRAKLNLAGLALKRDKKADAKKLLGEAAKEGLKLKATDDTKDLITLLTPAELTALEGKAKPAKKEASPLPVKGGEVDAAATRPAAPKGFDDVKVK